MRTPALLLVLGTPIWLSSAIAQPPRLIRSWSGVPGDQFGVHTALLGDLDHDGVPELGIGAKGGGAARIEIYSGRTGALHARIDGTQMGKEFGRWFARIGDFDLDGTDDIVAHTVDLASDPPVGALHIYSGRTTQELARLERAGWREVELLGDLDADAVADLIAWDAQAKGAAAQFVGRAELVSGRSGAVLGSYSNTSPVHSFGRIRALGDLDLDGITEFGIPIAGWPTRSVSQGVLVYSGRTRALMFHLLPVQGLPNESFGEIVCSPGDLDGDGVRDLVLSERGNWVTRRLNRIHAFAGPDGKRELLRRDYEASPAGDQLEPIGDVDGDARDDFLSVDSRGASIRVHSGRDGSHLHEFSGVAAFGFVGVYPMLGAGDVDSDGFPDFAVAGYYDPWFRIHTVQLYSGAPAGIEVFGSGCTGRDGRAPRIGAGGVPRPGGSTRFTLSRVAPGSVGMLVLGLSDQSWNGVPLPLDLTGFGMPGCTLSVSIDQRITVPTAGTADRVAAEFLLRLPQDPTLPGARFFAQWFVASSTPYESRIRTTRALRITVQGS